MPTLPQPKRLEAMIETAMLDRAPAMHQELKRAGTLTQVLRQRAEEARETFETMMDAALTENSKLRPTLNLMEGAADLTQRRDSAAEIAIAQATEFGESQPTEEPTTPLPAAA